MGQEKGNSNPNERVGLTGRILGEKGVGLLPVQQW